MKKFKLILAALGVFISVGGAFATANAAKDMNVTQAYVDANCKKPGTFLCGTAADPSGHIVQNGVTIPNGNTVTRQ